MAKSKKKKKAEKDLDEGLIEGQDEKGAEEDEEEAQDLEARLAELEAELEKERASRQAVENALGRSGTPLTRQVVKETPIPDDLDPGPDIDPETGAYRPAKYATRRGNIREDH